MEIVNLTNTGHFYTITGHYLREGDFPKSFVYDMTDVYEFVINLNDFITYKRGNKYIVFKFPVEFMEILDNFRKDYRILIKDCKIPEWFMKELEVLMEG